MYSGQLWLSELCVFGTAMAVKKVFFVFLFMKIMSGRLNSIVLSLSMLRLILLLLLLLIIIIIIIIIQRLEH